MISHGRSNVLFFWSLSVQKLFMLKYYILILLSSVCFALNAQLWEQLWHGEATGRNEGVGVTHTSGGVVFGGNFRGQFEYDGTVLSEHGNFQQGFLAKANTDGSLAWMHKIRGSNNVFTEAIAIYDDVIAFGGVYVDTLFLDSDTLINEGQKGIFVALYDTLGNYLRAIHPDVNSAMIFDLHFDVNGDLLITGDFFRWFEFGEYSFDSPDGMNIYVAKYDVLNNEVKWMVTSEGNGNYGKRIDTDSEGNICLVGSYGSNTVFLNEQLPNNNGNHNFFCAKLSTHGTLQWVRTIMGTGQVHGNAVKFGKNERIFFSGDFELEIDSLDTKLNAKGYTNAFIGSYESNGDLTWIQRVGGEDNDKGVQIEIDSIGNPITLLESGTFSDVGGVQLPTNGFYEPLILKLDQVDGNYIWHSRVYGVAGFGNVGASDFCYANRNFYITGSNRNGIFFNENDILAPNNSEFYVAMMRDTSAFDIEDSVNYVINNKKEHFKVFPNPSEGMVFIKSSDQLISEVQVYDLKGKLLSTTFPSGLFFHIELPPNQEIYLVKIISDSTSGVYKILKL